MTLPITTTSPFNYHTPLPMYKDRELKKLNKPELLVAALKINAHRRSLETSVSIARAKRRSLSNQLKEMEGRNLLQRVLNTRPNAGVL